MVRRIGIWVSAARPRTLPLAFAPVTTAAIMAAAEYSFHLPIYLLALLTAILLQILSNFANDYGDAVHGADCVASRRGPARAVQSGIITPQAMKRALLFTAAAALCVGLLLLSVALRGRLWAFLFFLVLGVAALAAAIAYTMGKKPYGYAGLGDVFVFIFFGPVATLGLCYLLTHRLLWSYVGPAVSCGALAVAVLNINNIRDIQSDAEAGKRSIPVRCGRARAVVYHWALLAIGFLGASAYLAARPTLVRCLFLLFLIPLIINGFYVYRAPADRLDAGLRQMALAVLCFVALFGASALL